MATANNRTVGDPQDEARQLFRNRYRELEEAARNWRIVATGAVAVALVLAGGSIYLAVRSRFVPLCRHGRSSGICAERANRGERTPTNVWRGPNRSLRGRWIYP